MGDPFGRTAGHAKQIARCRRGRVAEPWFLRVVSSTVTQPPWSNRVAPVLDAVDLADAYSRVAQRPNRDFEIESEMQSIFVRWLHANGDLAYEQVNVGFGWADVVAGELVYELKFMRGTFSRHRFYEAVGQAVVYAGALGLKPAVVVDESPPGAMRAALEKAGVRVIVFRRWWPCPRCIHSYCRSSAEKVGWCRRGFCGICAGEAEEGGGS